MVFISANSRNAGLLKMFVALALTVSLSSKAAPARAEPGNEFLRRCGADASAFSAGVCSGYAVGFADGLDAAGIICIPGGVENGQIKTVIIDYLNRNPSRIHLEIAGLAAKALIEAWPCKSK